MSRLEIQLPDELKNLAEQQVAKGRFETVSEYVSTLIRQDCGYAEEEVAILLRQRLASGPSTPMTDEDFDGIRTRLKAEYVRRHRR